jgi:hypothetical protein
MLVRILNVETRTLSPLSLSDLWRIIKAHKAFIALLAVAALVRLLLAPFPFYPHDPQEYAS